MSFGRASNSYPSFADGEIGTAGLEQFLIVKNDLFDVFIKLLDGNSPEFTQTLEILGFQSTNVCAFVHYEPDDFRQMLKVRTNPLELRLAVSHHDGLVVNLPLEWLDLKFSYSIPFLWDMEHRVEDALPFLQLTLRRFEPD
jgi:hypothetical protein